MLPPFSFLLHRASNGSHERIHFRCVELSVRSQSTTHIHTEWAHRANRLSHVRGVKTAGEKKRNVRAIPDLAAQRPIVNPSCSAEFFYSERWVAGIEQECVDFARKAHCFVN